MPKIAVFDLLISLPALHCVYELRKSVFDTLNSLFKMPHPFRVDTSFKHAPN